VHGRVAVQRGEHADPEGEVAVDGEEEIDIRGWIRTFADSGKPIYVGSRSTSASTPASGTRTAAT
jgi:hypothetical protein